ncbi:hypothetical protein [Janthinobacterium sp. BJB301]|uniref:hypothetical protein n=1 Tax=Janthinobacterium sp. BJB301 TaxID=1560195 RepID=UPI001179C0FE|nr:hypothetical protein [Janthinobacterium sp. BJB301]
MTSLFHLRLLSVFYLENVFTTCVHLTPQRKSSQPKKLSFLLKAAWQAARRGAFSPMKKRKKSSFELPLFFVKTFSYEGRAGRRGARARHPTHCWRQRHGSKALLGLEVSAYALRAKPTYADLHRPAVARGHLW